MSACIACAVATSVGLYWCWAGPLPGQAAFAVVALHAALGFGIGIVTKRFLPSRDAATRAVTAGASALIALGAAQATTLFFVSWSAPAIEVASATVMLGALGVALPVVAARRAGIGGPLWLSAAWLVALVPLARVPVERVPLRSVAAVPRDTSSTVFRRVAVVGLDGADWSVIDEMMDAGALPHLAALRARGVHAVARSSEPTFSPVVWTSIFTGKTPEKHGITGWLVSHAANRRAAVLWEVLAAAGMTSVVVNVPGTWPPTAMTAAAVVSGFPIPSALRPAPGSESQLLGQIIDRVAHPRPAPMLLTHAEGDSLVAEIPVDEPMRPARGGWHHLALDRLRHSGVLHAAARILPVHIRHAADGRRDVVVGTRHLTLAPGEWSPWLRENAFGVPVHFRLRALESGLYVTPFFQDPARPVHAWTSTPGLAEFLAAKGMYVVEGAGWKIAADPAMRDAIFQHLIDIEGQHTNAALALAASRDWSLLVDVITITDRASHAFWPWHDPLPYGLEPDAVRSGDKRRVVDAYRHADAELGRLLAAIGENVVVFVVSDHGFRADPPELRGNHRPEGIWIAAGPGITPHTGRAEVSVLDLTPTILAGFGLPVAKDMDGRSRLELLGFANDGRTIETYEGTRVAVAPQQAIDDSTKKQLRSLGYLE